MKKINLIVIVLLLAGINGLHAQESVVSSGGDATGSGGTAAYSVGQVVYTFVSGSTGSSNQGVQQPYEFFINGIDDEQDINLGMTVYPNPANSIINLQFGNKNFENLSYQLFDASGKQIINENIKLAITPIPMETFASGTYLLKVINSKSTLKTFTIIKNQ